MADTESDNEPDVLLEGCHELTQDDSSPVIDSAEEYPFIYLKHSKSEYTTKVYFKPSMPPQVAGRDPNCAIFLGDEMRTPNESRYVTHTCTWGYIAAWSQRTLSRRYGCDDYASIRRG